MDIFWEELTSGLPDVRQLVHVLIKLIAEGGAREGGRMRAEG